MKTINLKLASIKDKKPTINQKDIGLSSKKILIDFIDFSVVFYQSRNGKTYYAQNWNWDLPSIGNPLKINIKSIIEI